VCHNFVKKPLCGFEYTKDTKNLKKTNDNIWTLAGYAAMLPGMIYLHEQMGREIEQLKAVLSGGRYEHKDAAEDALVPEVVQARRDRARTYWDSMTKEQRAAEVARRMAKSRDKKTGAAGDWMNTTEAAKVTGRSVKVVRDWARIKRIRSKREPNPGGGHEMVLVSVEDVRAIADGRK